MQKPQEKKFANTQARVLQPATATAPTAAKHILFCQSLTSTMTRLLDLKVLTLKAHNNKTPG